MDDAQLLSAYVQTRSPIVLEQLIQRHIDFVYASALRQVKDPAQAEDVTQAVFIILTRKSASIRPASLTGWLFNTTRHCAANARRAELRRRHHERQAAKPEVHMQIDDSASPSLDHALSRLRHGDRQVVLLRYLQQREFTEVGSILGISEQTARRRLARAIERLRKLLSVGGQILPSAAIIQTLSTATTPAPAHLSAIVSAAATNIPATSTAAALATKTIHVMNWIKLKIAATILLAAAVAGTSSIAVVKAIGPQSAGLAGPIAPAVPAAAAAPVASTVATFPDGMRVELLGVAPSPAAGQKWWRPDGSPLPIAPYTRSVGSVTRPGKTSYEFALRLTGIQNGWTTSISAPNSGGMATGYPRSDILSTVVALPAASSAAVDFVCASGPWQTRANISADAVFTTGFMLHNAIFTAGKDDPKNTNVVVTADYASIAAIYNGDARFVAIDVTGNAHSYTSMTGQGGLLTETEAFSFPNIRPDQIKEFQLRTRPFNRAIEFQNISLIPGQLTVPQVQIHEIGSCIANFTAGGAVEVVGITNWPPTGKWWSPDGTPIDPIPSDYVGPEPKSVEQSYALAFKQTDAPGDPSSWMYPSIHSLLISKNANSPRIGQVIVHPGDKTMNFRIGLSGGPWQQWPTVITNGQPASVSVDNTQISFSAVTENAGNVIVTTTDNLHIDEMHDFDRQLVVTDVNGAAHIADLIDHRVTSGKNTFRIPQITKAQIKSYALKTREYEYFNFKGLPLKPGQHLEVTIEPDAPTSPTAPPKSPGEEGL
jgi:RNA polymerase sigma factor (sigma-70 family)